MKLKAMLGYKFFHENKDDITLIRLIKMRNYNDENEPLEVTVYDEGADKIYKIKTEDLKNNFTPLTPDGLLTVSIASLLDESGNSVKDVIVTASKIPNIKIGDMVPYAVCRQNITDIFYNLFCKSENDMMVGLAINQDDCPSNFDFRIMLSCDDILYSNQINFYRNDTLEDLFPMIKLKRFDEVLKNNYADYVTSQHNPSLNFLKSDKGWCKDLETLLKENNFQSDINDMLGITEVDFRLSDYLIEKPLPTNTIYNYQAPCQELQDWLSYQILKIPIKDATILEYGHDIDLSVFNNTRYLLLRDNTSTLYLIVYNLYGEEFTADLLAEYEKKDFSDEFRLKFYNKYNNDNK